MKLVRDDEKSKNVTCNFVHKRPPSRLYPILWRTVVGVPTVVASSTGDANSKVNSEKSFKTNITALLSSKSTAKKAGIQSITVS
jgi:hypothetical protein